MSAGSLLQKLNIGDDHPVTLVAGIAVIAGLAVVSNLPWFLLLTIGAIVSGILEIAIKEIPPSTEEYDKGEYLLWHAAISDDPDVGAIQKQSTHREPHPREQGTETTQQSEIDQVRDQYAQGELTGQPPRGQAPRLVSGLPLYPRNAAGV